MSATIHHGDCLDVLRAMPDNSVDAVVCDPPYGLSNTSPDKVTETIVRWAQGDREYVPTGKGFMSQTWDAFVPPVAVWDECLRVLKPGGHLVAFAGSRTQDLMGLAIRLAGFDIRENLAWLYGSGFPKSHDISKAIDKRGGASHLTREIGEALKAARTRRGMSVTQADRLFCDGSTNYTWFEGRPTGQRPPTPETFAKIVDRWPELADYASKVAEADREVIGKSSRHGGGIKGNGSSYEVNPDVPDITAPGTPEAEKWLGWGTALKPSHEPVVWATKPLDIPGLLSGIGSHLDALELVCRRNVRCAAKSSAPTPAASSEAKTDSAPESAATPREDGNAKPTPTGAAADSSAQTATSASASMDETFSNTVTSWRACWVELCELMSTSTTSTTTAQTIDLKTLLSSLSKITDACTGPSKANSEQLRLLASAVDSLFSVTVHSLRSTLALSAIESATASTQPRHQGEAEKASKHEPIILARKPFPGTVAANTLTWGTGGLNIDKTRIGMSDADRKAARVPMVNAEGGMWNKIGSGREGRSGEVFEPHAGGRWPSNVIVDHTAESALNEQSEGASRFFKVVEPDPPFMYAAKAPKKERPGYTAEDGQTVQHATVKPLSIMQWLVKLVTPEGGTILDPFAGSGTTVEAAILEGFHVIGIEREDAYLPLIQQRIDRANDVLPMAS